MTHLLKLIEGAPESASEFILQGDRLMLGRHVTADIPLFNATVNKNHAVLTRRDEAYFLEDWQSRSGTFVNRVRIDEPVLLNDGDVIQMGEVRLTYHRSGEPEIVADG